MSDDDDDNEKLVLPTGKPLTKENLIELRERVRPVGSGPLHVMGIAFKLCNIIAELKGWDLES